MRISVVVPAFNEAAVIADVVRGLVDRGYEVVVVDDGSADETSPCARSAGGTVLRHAVNRGYGAALETGSRWALARDPAAVVHFDADGQHDPDDIDRLVEPVLEGDADIVIGSRFLGDRDSVPFARRLLIKLAVLFTRVISGVRLTDAHNGLRAFSPHALRSVRCREDGMSYASEIVEQAARAGLRLRELPVSIRYSEYSRAKGEGNIQKVLVGVRFLWSKLSR